MSNKTRKHIWPVSLVMSIAIVGALAAFLVLAGNPGAIDAHDGSATDHCAGQNAFAHDIAADLSGKKNQDGSAHTCDNPVGSNQAPTRVGSIAAVTLTALGAASPMDVSGNFIDADDDALTYSATSSDTSVATTSVSGSMVTIIAVADGTATITVTANDGTADSPAQTFMVTVSIPTEPDMVTLDGKTGGRTSSGSSDIQLTVQSLAMDMSVGSAIVLYLEDDFIEPDSIPMTSVYLVAEGGTPEQMITTGRSARVYVTSPVKLSTSDYFTADKNDIAIRVLVPDMCTNNDNLCEGPNGLHMGQKISVVLENDSGIKNPSEAGTHSTGYSLLGPSETEIPNPPQHVTNTVATVAKITPSDVDNSRGYEMTITGSGFNNGTSAAVHVLADSDTDADLMAMVAAGGTEEADACRLIIRDGHRVGIATVGSDDKVAVTFEVTVPTFRPGNQNYICMVDGEGRTSSTDVEDFKLEPSIRVVPSSASTGDTVNVFAQDYPNAWAGFTQLKIAGQDVTSQTLPNGDPNLAYIAGIVTSQTSINEDGSGTATFELPGSISGSSLEGTLRIDARWGGVAPSFEKPNDGVSEDGKITVLASALRLSQSEVRANDSITIQGEGFGDQTTINPADITMGGVPLHVDNDSLDGGVVKVSNAGQFVATVAVWKDANAADNPALIAGTHTIKVRDSGGFLGTATIVVKEPSINTLPLVAGPRDVITITGENWPVDNPEGGSVDSVEIEIDDDPNRQPRKYTAIPDLTGRFTLEHRVSRDVGIPSDNQIKVTYGDSGEIVKISSFAVPESIIEVSPAEAQPGETISLSVSGMPVYTNVYSIEVGGRNVLGGQNFSTDRAGAVTSEVTVPGLDPGTYSVIMEVGEEEHLTIAIGEVEILSEGAIGTEVTAADGLANLGDNLVAVFHFNNAAKEWSFYDPRPEFADLNTLDNMVQGEAYWILIAEDVDEVVLNNKVRSLTCRGDDCWNLEVW